MISRISLVTISITALILLVFPILNPQGISALSGSQFSAGRIIDDQLFFNGTSMTVSQIQSFLNAKVPDCDSNGDIMYNSTQTRKQYAAANGVFTPFICLKSYKQNTPSRPSESGLCSALSAKSNRSAANIINDVANACGVSEKVLLVLIQKEQSLITDDWPWPIQYRSATGFGCPDTAPCDEEYYGFFNQVYNAARQFKRYAADPTHYNHRAGFNNSIRFHPTSSCGSSTVFIENQATAGLYNYTPYQPNQAALNNLYGTGNSCSAYGNRNFWRIYNDWFGNTTYAFNVRVTTGLTISPSNPVQGQDVTASFVIKNYEDFEINIGGTLKIAGRDPDGNNADFEGVSNITIPANSTYTISSTRSFEKAGGYKFWIASYRDGFGWSKSWPVNTNSTIVRTANESISRPNIRVTTSLDTTPNKFFQSQTISASFVIKNYENFPVTLDAIKAAVRGPKGEKLDFPGNYDVTISPNSTYSYLETRSFNNTGEHVIWITSLDDAMGWSSSYPSKTNTSIVKSLEENVHKPNIRVTSSLSSSPQPSSLGQSVTAIFVIKNYEDIDITFPGRTKVAARDANGTNVDFVSDADFLIPAKSTYTYSDTRTFAQAGVYDLWISSYIYGNGWTNTYPSSTNSFIIKSIQHSVTN